MHKKAAWWIVGLALLSGCVPSLNAIYTDKDIVFKSDVLGVWKQENSTEKWEFRQRDAKSYRLLNRRASGSSGVSHTDPPKS